MTTNAERAREIACKGACGTARCYSGLGVMVCERGSCSVCDGISDRIAAALDAAEAKYQAALAWEIKNANENIEQARAEGVIEGMRLAADFSETKWGVQDYAHELRRLARERELQRGAGEEGEK